MRILHVTQGYYPAIGGTELLIQRVSEELVAQFGDEVTVFTTDCYNGEGFHNPGAPRMTRGWEERDGVRIQRFPVLSRVSSLVWFPQVVAYRLNLPLNQYLRALYGGPVIPGLAKAIRRFPADVVSASSFPLLHMFAAARGARQSDRPLVLHGGLHPEDDWGFQRPMIYRMIPRASRYIANTSYEAQYVLERGASEQRVRTIGVGVDPDSYGRTSAAEAKRRLGVDPGPTVGFIGQIGGHKGVDTLLRAMPRVWIEIPEARLLIAGSRTDYAIRIDRWIDSWPEHHQQQTTRRYSFPQGEKPWLFGSLDVFAYPSGFESFGIAYLEAWASGKPVIGCRRGAVPSVIEAGRDGLLIDYQDEDMLAEAIIMLLKNPDWACDLGEAGKRKVLMHFTWPKVASRFREVYQEALRERNRPE
ncbi:MAG: glycosyltransferase family 4 protein [Anaerolineae bacterium]|nr:MAG: glycosyltransferase family 4 protein [Anaerolineae bacterium]